MLTTKFDKYTMILKEEFVETMTKNEKQIMIRRLIKEADNNFVIVFESKLEIIHQVSSITN